MISTTSTTLNLVSSLLLGLLLMITINTSANTQAFNLPAGADELLRDPLNTDFSCEGRKYGYFADVANNCQLFHICLPIEDEEGAVQSTSQFTMLCSNGTIFDQQTLACNFEQDALPCEEAENFYDTVKFGVTDDAGGDY